MTQPTATAPADLRGAGHDRTAASAMGGCGEGDRLCVPHGSACDRRTGQRRALNGVFRWSDR